MKNIRVRQLGNKQQKPTLSQLRQQVETVLEANGIKETLKVSCETWNHRNRHSINAVEILFNISYWCKGEIRTILASTAESLILALEKDLLIVSADTSNADISI